jgi:MFS transporter, DHA3 family, macrolide efflux protein
MGILRPLRGRSMALLWGGLSLSAVGDQLYAVALTWIAVGVLGSNAG